MEEQIVGQPETEVTKTGTEDIKTSENPTDTEVVLAAQTAEIERLEKERDGIKTARLKERGDLTEENFVNEENRETVKAVVDKAVKEALLSSQIVQARQKQEEYIAQLAKENKELKVALKSKAQPTNASQGSSSEAEESKVDFFTKEQEEEIFKKFPNIAKNPKGLETLKANILKNRVK